MTEFNYPECTTSVITALAIFRKHYPHYRAADIARTITKAVDYLHKAQRPEGLWLGSCGIYFMYTTRVTFLRPALTRRTDIREQRVHASGGQPPHPQAAR